MNRSKSMLGLGGVAALTAALALTATDAHATITREGAWPSEDPKVSLDLDDVTRTEALKELAEEAGWSLVLVDSWETGEKVQLHIDEAPASVVLEGILMGQDWVVSRTGNVVRIAAKGRSQGAAPTPPTPPTPPAASIPTRRESRDDTPRDIAVTGDSVRIGAGETVRDVTVMGGSADIEGHVTGDVAVVGGSVHIHPGAHVERDVEAVGGSITIDEGGRVDGEVNVVGGLVFGSGKTGRGVKVVDGGAGAAGESMFARASRAVSNAVSSAALLFVFGAVLIALAGDRFDQLRGEIAARPMKSIAMGLVGGLATILALIVVAVTVIGIPFAAIGLILFLFAIFAGAASAATTAGAALAGHRFKSPYGHLAVGCAIYLVAGLIPWVGGWIQIGMILAGYGAIVSTRAAGLIRRKHALPPATPYR